MSIENLLVELTAAIRENTEALRCRQAPAGLTVTTIEPKAEVKTEKPKVEKPKVETKAETKAEPAGLDYTTDVKPLVIQYASAHGKPALLDLLATFGTDSALKFAQECTPADLQQLHDKLAEGLL